MSRNLNFKAYIYSLSLSRRKYPLIQLSIESTRSKKIAPVSQRESKRQARRSFIPRLSIHPKWQIARRNIPSQLLIMHRIYFR